MIIRSLPLAPPKVVGRFQGINSRRTRLGSAHRQLERFEAGKRPRRNQRRLVLDMSYDFLRSYEGRLRDKRLAGTEGASARSRGDDLASR